MKYVEEELRKRRGLGAEGEQGPEENPRGTDLEELEKDLYSIPDNLKVGNRVGLWEPRATVRGVNLGQRFNRGFDRVAPIERRWKAAWWKSLCFIWAVAWFTIEPI